MKNIIALAFTIMAATTPVGAQAASATSFAAALDSEGNISNLTFSLATRDRALAGASVSSDGTLSSFARAEGPGGMTDGTTITVGPDGLSMGAINVNGTNLYETNILFTE